MSGELLIALPSFDPTTIPCEFSVAEMSVICVVCNTLPLLSGGMIAHLICDCQNDYIHRNVLVENVLCVAMLFCCWRLFTFERLCG